MRRYTIQIPTYEYWRTQIKCQTGCPVHTDSRGYVQAIREENYELAYIIARAPNPFASICGRICAAPCEANCRRGTVDSAISIRALKRFVTEKHGSEAHTRWGSMLPSDTRKTGYDLVLSSSLKRENSASEEIASIREMKVPGKSFPVAIIGGGPAGLSAAHDLALMGHKPCIFEMEPVCGGMLAVGVPEYRLPREIIEAEIDVIRSMGVEIRCGVSVGKDITFQELRKDFRAILIAVGAKKSRTIPLPGSDLEGVIGGVDFLRDVAIDGNFPLPSRVVVVGGGNVAFDTARTAIRQVGVSEVQLFCLEKFQEMPADKEEIEEGEAEGIIRHNSWGPKAILGADGKVRQIQFMRCISVFDREGRFNPVFDEYDTLTVETDAVLLSVGQAMDFSFLDAERDGIEMSRGRVSSDLSKLTTSAEGVFIAGDCAYGPRIAIEAVASGKKAARMIHSYLTDAPLQSHNSWSFSNIPSYGREKDYDKIPRTKLPMEDVTKRLQSTGIQIETTLSGSRAALESERCLVCSISPIFDGNLCILCGGCADVCPTSCLRLVDVRNLRGGEEFEKLLQTQMSEDDEPLSAIIKDETRCIRCGLCMQRCPVGAITMERFSFCEAFAKASQQEYMENSA